MSEKPTPLEKLDEALANIPYGQSFFVEGMKPEELSIVRRRAYKLGMRVEIRSIIDDTIFVGKSGSRIWNRGKVNAQRHG
jgi:hypothetical protein